MSRIPVPYSPWSFNGSVPDPTPTTADATNDHVVNAAVPERTVLRLYNTAGSEKEVVVRAGTYPPTMAAGQGSLVFDVPAGAISWLGPFESGRFSQANGSLEVDLESGFTGSITAFLAPKE